MTEKVRLGQAIFVIFQNTSISKTYVYMKGKTEFCHTDSFNGMFVANYRAPLKYNEYKLRWFKKLKDAKDYLYTIWNPTINSIVKVDEDYWEVRDK